MTQQHEHAEDTDSTPVNPALIGWAIAAMVGAIVMVSFNHSAMVLGAGIFMKCLAVLAGSLLGFAGALLGDAIRKFAHPDAVYTSGGIFSLIGIKLFWMLGPQVIGLLIGISVGCSFVLR